MTLWWTSVIMTSVIIILLTKLQMLAHKGLSVSGKIDQFWFLILRLSCCREFQSLRVSKC